jgi:hypothetical protein
MLCRSIFVYHLFGALLLLFQTPTPQKRNGGKRANSGRKSKNRRTKSINWSVASTEKAKLHLRREIYEEKMKKVKPTTGAHPVIKPESPCLLDDRTDAD